jgi:hypothetical protein
MFKDYELIIIEFSFLIIFIIPYIQLNASIFSKKIKKISIFFRILMVFRQKETHLMAFLVWGKPLDVLRKE